MRVPCPAARRTAVTLMSVTSIIRISEVLLPRNDILPSNAKSRAFGLAVYYLTDVTYLAVIP
jgi:hypothetical protein